MRSRRFTKLFYQKMALFPLIFVFIVLNSSYTAHAGVWGADIAITIWKQSAEEIAKNLRASITGALKQGVGQIMNTQISVMVGGGNGKGPMFITNWQTALVSDPQKRASSYMNDFFSMTTRGRNSSANYKPAQSSFVSGDSGCESGGYKGTMIQGNCVTNPNDASTKVSLDTSRRSWLAYEGVFLTAEAAAGSDSQTVIGPDLADGLNKYLNDNEKCLAGPCLQNDGNYYKRQTDTAKAAINPSMPDIDLMNYVNGPSDIFTGGSWRGFNAFFSNPANNPFGYSLLAQEAYQNKSSQERHQADIQAIAYQGFKASVGKDGVSVKTPGITIGQLVSKVNNFSLDSISSAQDWGAIISSTATIAINAVVQKGLNMADDAIQSGINTATGSINGATGLNLNVGAPSLADVNWSNSGSGQSSEFNGSLDNFNTDVQQGLTGSSQVWGDMNFKGTDVGSANASNQNSYSPLDSVNFQSSQSTASLGDTPSSFIPETSWTAPKTPQSSDPFWTQ